MKEWTLTLPRQLSLWEMESRWTLEILESNLKGQNLMACGVPYITRKLLELTCLKCARIVHLDIETQVMAKRKVESQTASLIPD